MLEVVNCTMIMYVNSNYEKEDNCKVIRCLKYLSIEKGNIFKRIQIYANITRWILMREQEYRI
jgi:hypothetical protein